MPPEKHCPSCGSDDVHFRTKRGDWICLDCDGTWVEGEGPRQAAPPVAVFVSYGHADSSDFAARLKTDLEAKGITPIWLDTEMIAGGDNWPALIESGIRNSDVLLAIMTIHSMAECSVCQDEVAFAVAEGKRVVPVRITSDPSLRPSLLLARRSWVDFSDDYDEALSCLLGALEGAKDALKLPAVELVSGLVPLDFSPEMARHQNGFVGRQWLFDELDTWVATSDQRAFVIVGEPGAGKSAIAARLASRESTISAHFCSTANARTLDPREFVANLVAQLAVRVEGFEHQVHTRHPELGREHASDAFRELVVEPARAVAPPAQPRLIIVDALDEAATREGETIVDLIASQAQSLPSWLRIVATSRPDSRLIGKLEALCPVELLAASGENARDVTEYLTQRLEANEALATAGETKDLITAISLRADGNFLYAKMAADAIDRGILQAGEIATMPPGLNGCFSSMFAKDFPDPERYLSDFGAVLRVLAVAFTPLSLADLSGITGIERTILNLRLNRLRQYLRSTGTGVEVEHSLFHRALSEWLCDPSQACNYWCDPVSGHEAVVAALMPNPLVSRYSVRWLPSHLLALGQASEAAGLLADTRFLTAAWELDPYAIRRAWATIERQSGIGMLEAYGIPCNIAQLGTQESATVVAELVGLSGHVAEALGIWEQLSDAARASGDASKLRLSLMKAANLRLDLGDYEAALDRLIEDERLCREAGVVVELGEVLNLQAKIRRRRGEYDAAMQLAVEAETLFRGAGATALVAGSLRRQGLIHRRLGDYDAALNCLDAAEEIYADLGHLDGLSRTRGNIAVILQRRGEYERALSLNKDQEAMCREMGTPDGVQRSLGNQAVILRLQGRLAESLELLREQEALCRDMEAPYHLARCLGNQALVMLGLGDTAQARVRSEEQWALCQRLQDDYASEECLGVRAKVAWGSGCPEEALELLQRQLVLCRRLEDAENLATCLAGLGRAFSDQGQWREAEAALEESVRLTRELGSSELDERESAYREVRERLA